MASKINVNDRVKMDEHLCGSVIGCSNSGYNVKTDFRPNTALPSLHQNVKPGLNVTEEMFDVIKIDFCIYKHNYYRLNYMLTN